MKQPFFIGGIDDVEIAKGSAFGAAGTFFFTFTLSVVYMIHDARQAAGRPIGGNSSSSAATGGGDSRSGGASGDYGQIPVFRDFDDPVNTHVPENFDTGVFT